MSDQQQAIKIIKALFTDKRQLGIFFLGISQGAPWIMIGTMLNLWLQSEGISRTNIGLAGLIFTVYAVNFLWSPLVDTVKLSFIKFIGQRQRWIFLCQLCIAASCFWMSKLSPSTNALAVVGTGLFIAIFSATQDIAIDAYRVDSFGEKESEQISLGAGVITAGWWSGYAGLGALPLFLFNAGWEWPNLYLVLGGIVLGLALITLILPSPTQKKPECLRIQKEQSREMIQNMDKSKKLSLFLFLCLAAFSICGILASVFLSLPHPSLTAFISLCVVCIVFLFRQVGAHIRYEPHHKMKQITNFDTTLIWLHTALVMPLKEFFARNGTKLALAFLAFIVFFKLGEAFLGRMSVIFYKEVGFSEAQIGLYSKALTGILTVIFAMVGAVVNALFGIVRGLIVSGIAMASTNLLFAAIAILGPQEWLYFIAVVLDGFTAAWSTVAFVALISALCDHTFSATQYALLASLSNLGRTTLSSASGAIVDFLNGNWALFFVLTTVMVFPSLGILWYLRDHIDALRGDKKDSLRGE